MNDARELVEFNITREDIPSRPGFNPWHETPFAADMAHEDLRIQRNGDGARMMQVVILACQMIELANPGKVAMMTDHILNESGDVEALTITVV